MKLLGIVNAPFLPNGKLINCVLLLLNSAPSTLAYAAFWESTVSDTRLEQDSNAESAMLVTLLGMLTLVSP